MMNSRLIFSASYFKTHLLICIVIIFAWLMKLMNCFSSLKASRNDPINALRYE